MIFTIGEMAKLLNVAPSTLRYYDKEGLLPFVERSSGGLRMFKDEDIVGLRTIECLKSAGMPIKDIKRFLDWCKEGDDSLQKRRDMFYERKTAVEQQLAEIQNTLNMIQYKCWYYDTALKAGTEQAAKNFPVDEMPDAIRKFKASFSK